MVTRYSTFQIERRDKLTSIIGDLSRFSPTEIMFLILVCINSQNVTKNLTNKILHRHHPGMRTIFIVGLFDFNFASYHDHPSHPRKGVVQTLHNEKFPIF